MRLMSSSRPKVPGALGSSGRDTFVVFVCASSLVWGAVRRVCIGSSWEDGVILLSIDSTLVGTGVRSGWVIIIAGLEALEGLCVLSPLLRRGAACMIALHTAAVTLLCMLQASPVGLVHVPGGRLCLAGGISVQPAVVAIVYALMALMLASAKGTEALGPVHGRA